MTDMTSKTADDRSDNISYYRARALEGIVSYQEKEVRGFAQSLAHMEQAVVRHEADIERLQGIEAIGPAAEEHEAELDYLKRFVVNARQAVEITRLQHEARKDLLEDLRALQ